MFDDLLFEKIKVEITFIVLCIIDIIVLYYFSRVNEPITDITKIGDYFIGRTFLGLIAIILTAGLFLFLCKFIKDFIMKDINLLLLIINFSIIIGLTVACSLLIGMKFLMIALIGISVYILYNKYR